MGTNKRYAAHYDRLMDERLAEQMVAGKTLQSLSEKELRLDVELLTIDPQPKPVKAWVRFNDTPLEVKAWACRWTSRAVAIRFEIRGTEYRAWVWRGAVEEDDAPRPTPEWIKSPNAEKRPAPPAEG